MGNYDGRISNGTKHKKVDSIVQFFGYVVTVTITITTLFIAVHGNR